MLIRLIAVGLQTLTQARQPAAQPAPASHVNGQGAPALAVPVSQISETATARRPASHALPRETLQAMADERTHGEGLSLRAFAQRLFAKDIYQAKAKDGSRVPAHPGHVKKWLEQARAVGVL